MPDRRIAISIDGGFFLKRLPKLVTPACCETPEKIAGCICHLCRNHVKALLGATDNNWIQYLYRVFYYDAIPYDGKAHHPIDNRPIDFTKSDVAKHPWTKTKRCRHADLFEHIDGLQSGLKNSNKKSRTSQQTPVTDIPES